MRVLLNQLLDNPYRDKTKYPISRVKVDALKESVKKTGFWDNLLARPKDNAIDGVASEGLQSHLASLAAAHEQGEPKFQIELAYGHHRLEAVRELGMEEIDIPVKAIDNERMLQIMANENKGDWSSNMGVILETVRQTRQYLQDTVAPYITFEEYESATPEPFFTREQFGQIPENGIGFRSIRKFLGETWPETDIRHAVAVLKNVEDGLYEQEQIIAFPSVGVLGAFSKVAEGIQAQPWPAYFKRKMIDDISTMISNPEISTTVKTLKSAQSAVKDGKDPVRVVKNPGQKRVDFSIVQEIKDIVYENMDPKAPKLEDITSMEGFKDFEGLDKILEDVQKSINRSEAAKKGAEIHGAAGAEANSEDETGAGMDQAELDQVVADAEASKAAGALPDMPAVLEGDDDTEVSVDVIADRFTQSVPTIVAQIDSLGSRLADIESADHPVFNAAEVLFRKSAALFVAIYSRQDAETILSESDGEAE